MKRPIGSHKSQPSRSATAGTSGIPPPAPGEALVPAALAHWSFRRPANQSRPGPAPGRYRIEMPDLGGSRRLAAVRVGDQAAPDGVAQIDRIGSYYARSDYGNGRNLGPCLQSGGQASDWASGVVAGGRRGRYPGGASRCRGPLPLWRRTGGNVPVDGLGQSELNGLPGSYRGADLGAQQVVVEAGRNVTSDLRLVRK